MVRIAGSVTFQMNLIKPVWLTEKFKVGIVATIVTLSGHRPGPTTIC
jgi:hypothetical protein